jgi:hypothetical protein
VPDPSTLGIRVSFAIPCFSFEIGNLYPAVDFLLDASDRWMQRSLGPRLAAGFSGCSDNRQGLGWHGMGRGAWCACSPPGRVWRLRACVTQWVGPCRLLTRGDGSRPTLDPCVGGSVGGPPTRGDGSRPTVVGCAGDQSGGWYGSVGGAVGWFR